MAIVKRINTRKGPATYWVVGLIQLDNFSKTAYLKIMGFYDKEHADLVGALPIETVEINITPDQYEEFYGSTDAVKKAYEIFSKSEVKVGEEAVGTYDLSGGRRG